MPAQNMMVLTMWPACGPNRGIGTVSRNPPLATATTSRPNQTINARSGMGLLPRRMSIKVPVRGQPPQVGPVGTNDVDRQAPEPLPQGRGIDLRSSMSIALEHDPVPVARPVSIVIEPRTVHEQSELPALEIEDAKMGTPGLQRVHFPDGGASRDDRESDGFAVRRPLRTVQEGRVRAK